MLLKTNFFKEDVFVFFLFNKAYKTILTKAISKFIKIYEKLTQKQIKRKFT